MSFVLSKQYSDDLSQKVTRGNTRKRAEGKSSTPKHGYIVTEEGYYKPDKRNFELIQTAWELRAKGESIEQITKFMNDNDYSRVIKRTGRKVDMDMRILSKIFKDPFYYGILIQAKQTVDLKDIYNFVSATTEDIYNQVQQLSFRRLRPFNIKRRSVFYPLRGMIICSFCNHNMVVGPSKGQAGKRFLYYRCDNPFCTKNSEENRKKHRNDPTKIKPSIRARVIFNFIYELLKDGLDLTEEDYNDYYNNLTKISDTARQKLGIEIHSLQGKLTKPEEDRLNIEEFLNLSKNAGAIIQSADVVIKDQICREIFLNLTVNEEKVLSCQLKPHFEEMIKQHQLRTGRGDRN